MTPAGRHDADRVTKFFFHIGRFVIEPDHGLISEAEKGAANAFQNSPSGRTGSRVPRKAPTKCWAASVAKVAASGLVHNQVDQSRADPFTGFLGKSTNCHARMREHCQFWKRQLHLHLARIGTLVFLAIFDVFFPTLFFAS